jgi:transposase
MNNKKWTPDRQELVKAYLKSGLTVAEVAIQLKDSYHSIETAIKKYNLRDGIVKEKPKKEKTRFKNEEVVEELKVYIDSAKNALMKYNDIYKNIQLKTSFSRVKQSEDMALVWSDMHTGMINRHPLTKKVTYNEAIQEKELGALLKATLRFQQLQKSSYNIETLYILNAGDNITNDRIYEGQLGEITCGVGEQVIKCANYQSDFIKKTLEVFPRVKMISVPGNHGRTTAKPIGEDATNSFEYLMGQIIKERFRDNKRVEIITPESYSHSFSIYNHRYLLTHGNIVKGGTLNSIEKAVKDIASLAYSEFYNLVIIGHFHTSLKLRITPETNLLVNGCFIPYDDYAYNKLHKFSSPTQYLFNISKKSPMHDLREIELAWE